MRILYVANYQGPDLIEQRRIRRNLSLGGNRKIELLARVLQGLGHDVVVLATGTAAERSGRYYSGFDSTIGGVPEVKIRMMYAACLDAKGLNYPSAILSALVRLRCEAVRSRFDLLLTYNVNEFSGAVTWFYWNRIAKIPLILEYEDSVAVASRGTGPVRRAIWRNLERWMAPRLAGVFSVNPANAERLQNPNTYILHGIVEESFCRSAQSRPPAFSGPPPYRAVYSGRLSPGKGIHQIFEIAAEFKGYVRFLITGGGPLEAELRAQAQICGGDVEILGYLQRSQLEKVLIEADILINPHENETSGGIMPFKLVEYLVAGGVVITTPVGDLQDEVFRYCEMTQPNHRALALTIRHVLAEPASRVARARAGQAWAISHYSDSAIAHSIQRVLTRAIGMPLDKA